MRKECNRIDKKLKTFVVMAVGARKNLPELSDCPLPLHYIGDCAGERPSNIEHAIKSAYDVACEI